MQIEKISSGLSSGAKPPYLELIIERKLNMYSPRKLSPNQLWILRWLASHGPDYAWAMSKEHDAPRRNTIAYNNFNVKIVASHAGLTVGPDGSSHQALEDIAIMRALPNMVVICPADSIEARKATQAIAHTKEPTYLRLSRDKVPTITTNQTPFEIGKAQVLTEGRDVTIIACGQMVYYSLLAAKELKEHNISVRVINCHTIKPLDNTTILKAAEDCGAIVTAEEHQVNGGLGSAVAELVSQHFPVPMKIIGVEDRFGESGEPNELLEKFGLTKDAIIKAVTSVLRMKEK